MLKLRVDEPRLVFVLSDLEALEALGATSELRDVERRYTARELAQAQWLHMSVKTGGIAGPSSLDCAWDDASGCAVCKRGRRPVAPLPVRASAMGRLQVRETWHHGFLFVRAGIAAALSIAVSGISVRPVKSPRASPLDAELRWLDVDGEWPDDVAEDSGYARKDACVVCGGASLHSDLPRAREAGSYRLSRTPICATWGCAMCASSRSRSSTPDEPRDGRAAVPAQLGGAAAPLAA